MKKIHNDELFNTMDWILKKKTSDPISDERLPQPFILNRWLSMVDSSIAQIINSTTNRWMFEKSICSDKILLGKFYKKLLPKTSKRYSYIKKSTKENTNQNTKDLIKIEEISNKEFEIYKKTLAELKL